MLFWLIIIVVIVVMLAYGYLSNYHLVTTKYRLTTSKVTSPKTFVLLSDLHCCKHGKDYNRLINRVRVLSPDYIFIPGDMITKHMSVSDKRVQQVLRLLSELKRICPVYYAPGNHEIRLYDEYDAYKAELKKLGITYIENEHIDLADNIKVYGLDLPLIQYRTKDLISKEDVAELLNTECADEESYSILLAHDPRYFKAYVAWGADLTLSGHVHGGIVRLPFLGGLVSPYLRLFPKYDAGEFKEDKKTMIVGRGLGTHHVKFRFFNPPEVIEIRLEPGRVIQS